MIKSAIKEYIFGTDEITKSCHASTVLPLEDGRVMAAWFGGKREKDDDVEIYVSVRGTDGTWSRPCAVTENDDVAHWNPVLYENAEGKIILFYKYGREIPDWVTKFVELDRDGRPVTKPAELVPGDVSGGRGPVKNKCLRLKSGVLLAPASTEKGGWRPFIDRSEDDGKTWTRCEYMERPKYRGRLVGLIQPTLWEDENGAVHAFMRSDAGAIYRSDSLDGGKTWSKPARTRLPNNNSGIDLTTDGKGRVWLLYNPVDVNWGVRHPLSLAVSTDNGKHFTEVLLPEPGNGEFSYPAVTCRDHTLYATYTHKRKQIVFWKIELE